MCNILESQVAILFVSTILSLVLPTLPVLYAIIFGILSHILFFTMVAQKVNNYLSPKNNVVEQDDSTDSP